MSNGEYAQNPQNPPLYQTLQESADLVNDFADSFNTTDVPLGGTIYDIYSNFFPSQAPAPGRKKVRLVWKSGDKLETSDGRLVSSMELDVPERSDSSVSGALSTYKLFCALNISQMHEVTVTLDDKQWVNIANEEPKVSVIRKGQIESMTPVYWKRISDADVKRLLTVFHDALQAGKPIEEEKDEEIREHN